MAESVVALHGFTQRGSSWDEVAAALPVPVIAPDLPGHGSFAPLGWDAAVRWVLGVGESAPRPAVLAGYSMGGRLALGAAVARPALASHLVLIGASPGIADPGEQTRRRSADGALARWLERVGVEEFLDDWTSRPMFAGLARRGPQWLAADRAGRAGSTASGLAGALRLLGRGVMPYLGGRLDEVVVPVTLVAGERDETHCEIAEAMAAALPKARVVVVPGAGHSVVGEDPEAVAAVLADAVAGH